MQVKIRSPRPKILKKSCENNKTVDEKPKKQNSDVPEVKSEDLQQSDCIKVKRKSVKKPIKHDKVEVKKGGKRASDEKDKRQKSRSIGSCLDLTEFKFKMVETMGENLDKRRRLSAMV